MSFGPLTQLDSAGVSGDRSGETIAETYHLLECIGSGGMGDVYAAEHLRLGKQFAVKLLRSRGAEREDRFRREARAIARVESEHVVSVVDSGEARDGTPYIVMELLRGRDLRDLLAEVAPLPVPRAVSLLRGACAGVAAVHRVGLVHRDLKPGNLFVTKRANGEDWCKVLDFGVAKIDTASSTVNGGLVGTVKYMAPEQLENGAAAGVTVDVYALGAILYECLSGEAPHVGVSVQELMFKIMNEAPISLSERSPHVPAELGAVVARALEKHPSKRFASVDEFALALAPFARTRPEIGREMHTLTVFEAGEPRVRKRGPWLGRVGAGMIGALCTMVVWALGQSGKGGMRAAVATTANSAVAPIAPALSPPEPTIPSLAPTLSESAASAPAPSARSASEFVPRAAPSSSRPAIRHVTTAPPSRFDATNPYEQ